MRSNEMDIEMYGPYHWIDAESAIEDAFNKEAEQLQLRLWKGMSREERIFLANRLDVECPVDTPWPTMFIDSNGYIRRENGRFL